MIVAVICIAMQGSSPVVLRLEPSVPVGTPCHPLVASLLSDLSAAPADPTKRNGKACTKKTRDRLKATV